MSTIKIHGATFSTAAMRSFACLFEKNVDFEFVPVNMGAGEHKQESYLKLNPFGQVPTFEQGDLILFESRAITQHIAHEYSEQGTKLVTTPGGKQMAIISLWVEIEAHQYDPAASKLLWEQVFKPMFGLSADAAVIEENETKLGKVLDVYEARLGESKYLACNCFTLADLHHLPTLTFLLDTPSKKLIESRPRVAAWVADIIARPAWAKVLDMKNKQ